jgi:hypothetical protein
MAAVNGFEVKRYRSPRVMDLERVVCASQRQDAGKRDQGNFVVHTLGQIVRENEERFG